MILMYHYIIRFLKYHKYTVLSEHVASEALEKVEERMSEQEIYEKDANWIEECDRVIAEITVPSIGVGYEICHAVKHRKPVLCVYQEGAKASAMVLGNTSGYITAKSYSDKKQLDDILLDFLMNRKL